MVGAFGQRNVGDEALCGVLCRALAGHDVTIVSRDPAPSRALHGRPTVPATPVATAREVARSDVVVVGGGTIFKTLHRTTGRRRNALLANTLGLLGIAAAYRVPVAFVGVGAGELDGSLARLLTRAIAPRADLLVLRDEESAAVLVDAGSVPPFWIGADPAWGLFHGWSAPKRGARADRRRVTVALSHLASTGHGTALLDRLGESLAALAGRGWHVTLQPWQHGRGDLAAADVLLRHVPAASIGAVPEDLLTAADGYRQDDLVVAMRFHALVAAGAARTRVLAIAHEPKLAGLARRLDQVAVPPDAGEAVITTALDWASDHAPPTAEAVRRQIDLADHTIRLLRLLVDGGRLEHPEELPALQLSDGEGRW